MEITDNLVKYWRVLPLGDTTLDKSWVFGYQYTRDRRLWPQASLPIAVVRCLFFILQIILYQTRIGVTNAPAHSAVRGALIERKDRSNIMGTCSFQQRLKI